MKMMVEQMKPPPLQMNLKVGVPRPRHKRPEDEPCQKQAPRNSAEVDERKRKISKELHTIECEVKTMQNDLKGKK